MVKAGTVGDQVDGDDLQEVRHQLPEGEAVAGGEGEELEGAVQPGGLLGCWQRLSSHW